MSLFSFARNNNNNNNDGNNNNNDGAQIIQLIINDETITVSAAEAEGKTVAELFNQYASSVADVSRINRYVAQGRIVGGATTAEIGTVYSGAIASESKG